MFELNCAPPGTVHSYSSDCTEAAGTRPMSAHAEPIENQENSYFRCPVQVDHGRATIRAARRKIYAQVQETSIDGFTVLVSPKDASKLKVGRPWVLEYDGTRVEVHAQWFFNAPNGHVQMGLRRLRDLTRPAPIKTSLLAQYGGKRCEDPSFSAAIFGGFVLALFSMMAMPGLGDSLGTSDRIQDTVQWIIKGIDQSIGHYL